MPGITVWTYKLGEGERKDASFSGIGTSTMDGAWGILSHWTQGMAKYGHAITIPYGFDRPWNHHVIGCGVGHDDAEFAETGRSMAEYYENGEAYGGKWWENTCLMCNAPITTTNADETGETDCQNTNGDHIPSGKSTFSYYNPVRMDTMFFAASAGMDYLKDRLMHLRANADEARAAGHWDSVTIFEKELATVAHEIRRRQQEAQDKKGN